MRHDKSRLRRLRATQTSITISYAQPRNIVFLNGKIQRDYFSMKIPVLIARWLLGLIFLIFGLNGFLHFIPMPLPAGVAGQFMIALFVSRYLMVVASIQVLTAVLLLINRYVPLALTLLAPVIFNILLFHALMAPAGLGMAIFVTILWSLVFLGVRSAFAGLFQQRVNPDVLPARRSPRVAQEV
jgi:putative oxidoreductase